RSNRVRRGRESPRPYPRDEARGHQSGVQRFEGREGRRSDGDDVLNAAAANSDRWSITCQSIYARLLRSKGAAMPKTTTADTAIPPPPPLPLLLSVPVFWPLALL